MTTPLRCWRCVALAALCAAALGLAGCAGLPQREALPPSFATADFAATALYRSTSDLMAGDGRSGFRLMPVASFSFATRVALARSAEKTLDVQYYLLENDNTGRSLMRELRAAAGRGVRVRLLIDDLYSIGEDRILTNLAALPNVEVRFFNPFTTWRSNGLTRLLGASLELARVDRRMHNKLFIADNAAVVMGGRNIGDEYFMRSTEANFVDIDLFVAGPAVRELSAKFDSYWNSSMVVPIARIVGPAPSPEVAEGDFERETRDAIMPPLDQLPAELLHFGSLPGEIDRHHVTELVLAPCTVLADRPDKSSSYGDANFPTVTRSVLAMLARAQHEAVIASPYFIPGDVGLKMMHDARAQGGRIVLVTNSLASTDEPQAEIAYMRYRKAMLEEGVIIRELSPSLARTRQHFGPFGSSTGSFHAKVIITDRTDVFIGSMNLDFRSAYENTEVGIIIESPQIAAQILGLVDDGSFYELRLGPAGNIEWVATTESGSEVFDADPETDWVQRVLPALMAPFVPEHEL